MPNVLILPDVRIYPNFLFDQIKWIYSCWKNQVFTHAFVCSKSVIWLNKKGTGSHLRPVYLFIALTQKLKYFRFSGITKAIMDPVTTRLPDVQKKIQELLPANAILCGQSLGGDLRAIKVQKNIIIHFRYRYGKIPRIWLKSEASWW